MFFHLDQNEKLINYGVTHVISVDGYCGKIVTHITSAVKNNLIIYDKVWRYDSKLKLIMILV